MSWIPTPDEACDRLRPPPGRLQEMIDHVNTAHLLDLLLIVWTVGGEPDALGAQLTDIERGGIRIRARVGGDDVPLGIAWTAEVRTWSDLQLEMVALRAAAYEQWERQTVT